MGDSDDVLFEGFLDGSYDCVDRVVLRAYFQLGQHAPGFTELTNARDLGLVADALSSPESSVGRLVQAPERWIYSAVLCFALDIADQERTGSRYHCSLFQAEYSRNLLFTGGQQMDRIFGALIDRVRGLRTVKTVFGRRQRSEAAQGTAASSGRGGLARDT